MIGGQPLSDQSGFAGNAEHLSVLLKAIEQGNPLLWNSYIIKYERASITSAIKDPRMVEDLLETENLMRYGLRQIDLTGANLVGADLRELRLVGTVFDKANLDWSELSGQALIAASLNNTSFEHAKLVRASLSASHGRHARFIYADLTGADLSEADFSECDFEGAKMAAVDFKGSTLRRSIFIRAFLAGADFRRISSAWFSFAQFRSARHGKLDGIDLEGAYLPYADLRDASITNANMRGTHMTGAKCDRADFTNTDLTLADLLHTSFEDSNLSGVCLFGAKHDGWRISRVICSHCYLDGGKKERIPANRNFESGEFEEYLSGLDTEHDAIMKALHRGRQKNHVFISYVREDSASVMQIKDTLESHGIRVWIDREKLQPGVDWELAIQHAIENGVYFLACFSKSYWIKKGRNFMNAELHVAIEQMRLMTDDHVWFIPVKLNECEIPNFVIRKGRTLTSKQWVSLADDWANGVQKIIDQIKSS